MFCWLFILLMSIGYSFLYYFCCIQNLYWLFLWIPLGILSSIITFVIFIIILMYAFNLSKPTNKFKHQVVWDIVVFLNIILKIKVEVVGKENIPTETFVCFSNHKSMLDITILYQAYHKVLSAVAKKSLGSVPLLNGFMKSVSVALIDRENDREGAMSLLNAIKQVKGGLSYIIFPEGGIKTRETEEMVALKAGAYKLATKPHAVISPVSIIGSSKLSKNCPWHKTKIKVIIHKPISFEEYNGLNTTVLGEKVEQIINEGVRNETI